MSKFKNGFAKEAKEALKQEAEQKQLREKHGTVSYTHLTLPTKLEV